MKTPVAFIVFNRPETTALVFERIRQARPLQLLVICDGPRPAVPGDARRVAEVRRIIAQGVDWPCEVLTNYAETNLGCRQRVASGLGWVFSQVEEAIILEDDCLPDPSFFPFCKELLERYRGEERVMHIAGSNLAAPRLRRSAATYTFSRQPSIWGWATWRRAWRHYDLEMATWDARQAAFQASFASRWEAHFWTPILNRARLDPGELNTWDFSWTYTCRSLGGLCIVPARNLVENIGIGRDSTHTSAADARLRLPAEPAGPMRHPASMKWDRFGDELRTLLWGGQPTGFPARCRSHLRIWRDRHRSSTSAKNAASAAATEPVAIVVPCYKPRANLAPFEALSYQRLWQLYGGKYPILLMAPPWLDAAPYLAEHPGLSIERFTFRTVRDYSQLLLQPHFYQRFRRYRHILIHQLDAYLLKDELETWCARGYDYIGAPIFHGFEPPEPEGKLWCVGNGGFSLRNVEAALRVLASRKHYLSPRQFWAQTPVKPGLYNRAERLLSGLLRLTRIHNGVRWATLCNFNEDIFWSLEAPHFCPGFKIPGIQTGLQFSFDYAPAYCYAQNGNQLPFGCHAWQRYDLAFWQKHIPGAASLPIPRKP